jgi:formyl-CoA transferase
MGLLPMHHVVPRLLGTPGSIRLPAPWLGQHNRELLEALGVDASSYQKLMDAGVVSESRSRSFKSSE